MKYNKLVRDNIPQIIEESGKKCIYKILNEEEFLNALKDKLFEEAKELKESKNDDEFIEELVDVFHVISYIFNTLSTQQLHEYVRKNQMKLCEKGVFDKKIFLIEVEE